MANPVPQHDPAPADRGPPSVQQVPSPPMATDSSRVTNTPAAPFGVGKSGIPKREGLEF
jgi:hypothetical protein